MTKEASFAGSPRDGVSCRCCGATFAPPHDNEWGVCADCYRDFADNPRWRYRGGDAEFHTWLAERLQRTAKRVHSDGIVGRCEAVTTYAQRTAGYQCAGIAKAWRAGRRVCRVHQRPEIETVFVGEWSPYPAIATMLRETALADPEFRRAMESALDIDGQPSVAIHQRFTREARERQAARLRDEAAEDEARLRRIKAEKEIAAAERGAEAAAYDAEREKRASEISGIRPLIDKKQVLRLVGISNTHLWRLTKRGQFPQPVRGLDGRLMWRPEVIEKWMGQCPGE